MYDYTSLQHPLTTCTPTLYANREVQKAISSDKQKRGPYEKYSAGLVPISASTLFMYMLYHVALVHRLSTSPTAASRPYLAINVAATNIASSSVDGARKQMPLSEDQLSPRTCGPRTSCPPGHVVLGPAVPPDSWS